MNIDRPLEDVIQEKRKSRGPRRPRGPRNGAADASATAPAPATRAAAPAATGTVHVGDKVIVSNLPDDVNEQQIRELFTSTVGPVRRVELSYNPQGKSKGIATVLFNKAEHATAAYQQYNKRLIDGKRPMKVEIIVDPSRANAAATSLAGRLAPAPSAPAAAKAARSATVAAAGGSAVQTPRQGGGRRPGGRGGRRGAGGRKGDERPKATVESLDAEMSDWQAQVQAGPGVRILEKCAGTVALVLCQGRTSQAVSRVCFVNSSTFIVGSGDATVSVWKLDLHAQTSKQTIFTCLATFRGAHSAVSASKAYSIVVSGDVEGKAMMWDLNRKNPVCALEGHGGQIQLISIVRWVLTLLTTLHVEDRLAASFTASPARKRRSPLPGTFRTYYETVTSLAFMTHTL
ncbi:hypothetical protein JCM10207_008639 [Rhodosporidiobolus poonsookiae]